MNAQALLDLLEQKHSRDVFVPECKNGQSYGAGLLKLDAWAMARSWAKPWTYGYEIKVNRSDFLRDDKWQLYLDYCTDFYFVCPPGVIGRDEVGGEAGLIWSSKNGTRLYTKKKAPRRQVQIPEDLFRYVLMCRSRIGREHTEADQAQYWKDWLAEKKEKRKLGYSVSAAVRRAYDEMECENHRLKRETEKADEKIALLKQTAEALGLRSWDWSERKVREAVERAIAGVPEDLEGRLKSARSALDSALGELELKHPTDGGRNP